MKTQTLLILAGAALLAAQVPAPAQSILFDFDTAPLYTSLPLDLTQDGLTAHFSATGQGYSIQSTTTAPVVPVGFTGRFIYPSSVSPSDLLVSFSKPLTNFSIQYSPQELGCDDSARMKVTAFMDTAPVGTNTTTAHAPGTWPVETLSITTSKSFNNVVVHYDARPPTCQDWGSIFIADNMSVSLAPVPPSLQIAWRTNQIQLAWPTNAAAFTLQANTNLVSTNAWMAVTNARAINGDVMNLTLPLETASRFYRLKSP
jgi:hypothetical protein